MKRKARTIWNLVTVLPEIVGNSSISKMVIVKLSSGRSTIGQYDYSRGMWYCVGSMQDETAVKWTEFPKDEEAK